MGVPGCLDYYSVTFSQKDNDRKKKYEEEEEEEEHIVSGASLLAPPSPIPPGNIKLGAKILGCIV